MRGDAGRVRRLAGFGRTSMSGLPPGPVASPVQAHRAGTSSAVAGGSLLAGECDAETAGPGRTGSVASAPMNAGREFVVVLCTPGGAVLGELPPVGRGAGGWQDVEDVVAELWQVFGVRVRILRILQLPAEDAGRGRYLAETAAYPAGLDLRPCDGDPLAEDQRRLRYALPAATMRTFGGRRKRCAGKGSRFSGGRFRSERGTCRVSGGCRPPPAASG